MTITQAMIMAAGHATRMRPLTDDMPKPLLQVCGKPLLTHIIDHLMVEGVTKIVINGYHAIDKLQDYMGVIRTAYPDTDFILSVEDTLLETGGGAVQAMQYLDIDKPFYMINGDAFWVNGATRTLQSLANRWDGARHDILLLLQSCQSMHMTDAVGDYNLGKGMAKRDADKQGEFMFTGVRVCTPSILNDYKLEKFSFLKCMDDAELRDRLGGVVHEGEWCHISTPQDLQYVNEALS